MRPDSAVRNLERPHCRFSRAIPFAPARAQVALTQPARKRPAPACSDPLQVGLLDIDICGPSLPKMLGLEGEEIHQSGAGWSPVYVQVGAGPRVPTPWCRTAPRPGWAKAWAASRLASTQALRLCASRLMMMKTSRDIPFNVRNLADGAPSPGLAGRRTWE